MIKDVRDIVVNVGDKVAFAGGGRGASEFWVGVVTKITAKGITICSQHQNSIWDNKTKSYVPTGQFYDRTYQRNEGMFAILEKVE